MQPWKKPIVVIMSKSLRHVGLLWQSLPTKVTTSLHVMRLIEDMDLLCIVAHDSDRLGEHNRFLVEQILGTCDCLQRLIPEDRCAFRKYSVSSNDVVFQSTAVAPSTPPR
jgi:hypothetical protein